MGNDVNEVERQLRRVQMTVADLPKSYQITGDPDMYTNLVCRLTDMMSAGNYTYHVVFACHQTQVIDLLTDALKKACDQRDAAVNACEELSLMDILRMKWRKYRKRYDQSETYSG